MNKGFIKIHRKMTDWEWYGDNNTFRLFIHLLLKANHKKTKFRGNDIAAGSIIIGRKALAEELGMSEQQVRTSTNKLKSTSEITIKTTNKFSICTIVKWADYQANQPAEHQQPNQQVTNNQPTSNQQVTTSKECKNVRMEERKSKKRKTTLPTNFKPSSANIEYAGKNGINIDEVLDQFKANAIAKNVEYVDWHSGLSTWLLKRKQWAKEKVEKEEVYHDATDDMIFS